MRMRLAISCDPLVQFDELSTSSIEINEAGSTDSPSPADQDSYNIGSKPESLNPPEVDWWIYSPGRCK